MRSMSPPTAGDRTADCGDVTEPLTKTTCTTGRSLDWPTLTGGAASAAVAAANNTVIGASVLVDIDFECRAATVTTQQISSWQEKD